MTRQRVQPDNSYLLTLLARAARARDLLDDLGCPSIVTADGSGDVLIRVRLEDFERALS